MQLNQVKERSQEANGNRSRAPFQGARSLITIRSIESMEPPSLRCSSLGDSSPLSRCLPKIQPNRPNFTLPHPSPRSRRPSSPLALGRSDRSVRQLAAPRPARGGQDYPAKPKHTKSRRLGLSSLARLGPAPFSAPLLSATKGAVPQRACSLPSACASRSGTFLRSVALRYERSRPAPRFAIHGCYRIRPSSSARARGPRTPLAPRLRRSARACCTIMRVYDK